MSGPLEISLKDELLFIKSILIPAFNPKFKLNTAEERDEWMSQRAINTNWDVDISTELIIRYGTVNSLDEAKEERVKTERLLEKAEEKESKAQGGASGVLPRQCTRNVMFTFRRVDRTVAVTFWENIDVDKSVADAVQKFVPRNTIIAGYELRRADDVILTSFQSVLEHPGDLRYAPQTNLPIGSASDWDDICTSMLKVHLEEVSVDDLLGGKRTLSEEASALILKLADLDANNSTKYFSRNIGKEALEELRKDESLIQPVRKCLYLISKYLTNEALVDSLVSLLFHELGFYSGMLYPVPQHSLPLQYGGDVSATAKADFNVIDVLSFCRMVVAEDKNQASIRVNSFPQLMAESISAVQKNLETSTSCKRKWEELDESAADSAMLGLRVNGTYFYFYNINVSRPILSAMKCKGPASEDTAMKMVGGSEGLNFLDPAQREVIITILDAWRADIEKKGRDSVRRLSN